MNRYNIEDIHVGMQEEFSVTVTEKMQEDFRSNTGDINPIHHDTEFAEEKGFKDKLVFGMLTASFFSTLVGVYLPGENCLFQECKNIRFHAPVFVGDTLNINGEVVEVDERFNRITIKATIRNQIGKKVCSRKINCRCFIKRKD